MAIEIVPKPVPRNPFSSTILLYLSFISAIAAISGYLVLSSLAKRDADRIKELDEQMAQVRSPDEISLEKDIKMKKKKIDDFAKLIGEHRTPSEFFAFSDGAFSQTKNFGALIHPRVQILDFALDLNESKLNITGQADSFTTVGQQQIIFEQESLIKETVLSAVSFGKEGGINFSFDLSFDPNIFK